MATAIGALAQREDLIWQAGATFTRSVTYSVSGSPVDLIDVAVKMELRDRPGGTVLVTLSLAGGEIVISAPATGQMQITAIPSLSDDLVNNASYDLKITYPDGSVDRIMDGRVQLSPAVTE